MNRMNSVPIESPVAITRPMPNRDTAPAPVAVISGTTPSIIAAVVIRIGHGRMPVTRLPQQSASCARMSLVDLAERNVGNWTLWQVVERGQIAHDVQMTNVVW